MSRSAAILFVGLACLLTPSRSPAQEAREAGAQRDTVVRTPAPISPGGAFWRSLVIPGWAQAELDSPLRGAFYFLATSVSWVMVARTQQRLDHAERNLGSDNPLVESREQQREDWIALAVFWALFAAADGWVTSQLWGFSEVTGTRPGDVSFQVGWQIPLGP